MLDALSLLSTKPGEIVVGFDKDSDMNGRAEGNILGTYGQPEPITKPRDFLGITKKDLTGIIKADTSDVELTDDDIDAIARRAAMEIGISFEDN